MGKIYKTSLTYKILRVYSNFVYRRWFSIIEVNGERNIPENTSVIFAPNHQNGFIDAMALLSSSPKPVVFLARADLFKKKWLDTFLRSLKIMPAYRLRDGIQNLKKNEDSFEQAIDVLLNKEFFCLMPEGGQEELRTLRPLVKGMFRIAFATQDVLKESDSVKIVPVGIDYGNYDHTGGHLVVNFGKPIDIKNYYQLYVENAPVAQNQLRDELYRRMEPLMLNIQSQKYYDCFYTASYIYNYQMLCEMNLEDNETNRLVARQEIISFLQRAEMLNSPELPELEKMCAAWNKGVKDTSFSARVSELGTRPDGDLFVSACYLVLTLPLLLYAILINGVPYILTKLLTRSAKNTGFQASFVLGLAMVLFPLFYLGESIAFATTAFSLSVKLAFVATLPLSLYFMVKYKWRFNFVIERFKNITGKRNKAWNIRECVEKIIHSCKQ
jgi:1-acyl-sn-glycerol-3-phosphate acyltransferase